MTTLQQRSPVTKQSLMDKLVAVHNEITGEWWDACSTPVAMAKQEILDNPPRTQEEWDLQGASYREAKAYMQRLDREFMNRVTEASRQFNQILRDLPLHAR